MSLSKTLYPHFLVLVSTKEERATWKISICLLNVLPSINKVDYIIIIHVIMIFFAGINGEDLKDNGR